MRLTEDRKPKKVIDKLKEEDLLKLLNNIQELIHRRTKRMIDVINKRDK